MNLIKIKFENLKSNSKTDIKAEFRHRIESEIKLKFNSDFPIIILVF